MSWPIACNLTSAELQERRQTVLQRVRSAVVDLRELENGYAYCFPPEPVWLDELARLVSLEHECCPFLTFRITVEPAHGPIWLEMTGPQGTKEFLAATFA